MSHMLSFLFYEMSRKINFFSTSENHIFKLHFKGLWSIRSIIYSSNSIDIWRINYLIFFTIICHFPNPMWLSMWSRLSHIVRGRFTKSNCELDCKYAGYVHTLNSNDFDNGEGQSSALLSDGSLSYYSIHDITANSVHSLCLSSLSFYFKRKQHTSLLFLMTPDTMRPDKSALYMSAKNKAHYWATWVKVEVKQRIARVWVKSWTTLVIWTQSQSVR